MYHHCPCITLNPPPPPPPPPCTNCIWGDQPVVACSLITQLCGQQYSIVVNSNTGNGVFTVKNFDLNYFSAASFVGNTLFFTVSATSGANQYADIYYTMTDPGFPDLSFTGHVRVCIPNFCANILPPVGMGCNQCDGTLFVLPPEIFVG